MEELREDPRCILVEGNKDVRALETFGITKTIKVSHSPQRAVSNCPGDAIILTDYDETGRKLASQLSTLLESEGKHADLDYRKELRRITRITTIEELVPAYEHIKGDENNGKNLHRHRKIHR